MFERLLKLLGLGREPVCTDDPSAPDVPRTVDSYIEVVQGVLAIDGHDDIQPRARTPGKD